MAGTSNDSNGKKAAKPAAPKNPRMAELQARAASAASSRSQSVSPQQFFQEALVELKKTTWPSKDVLTKSTMVVLAFVLSVAVWVGIIDVILAKVMPYITGR